MSFYGLKPYMPSLCPFIFLLVSLSLHHTAQAGHEMGGFLWQSASPLLAGTGPGTCYWLGVWKGSREVERGEEKGVGREIGFGRRETGGVEGWRRGLQLVMKSSLFILRRQSVSGRARGLCSSTALSACNAPLCAACVSICHSWQTQRHHEQQEPLQSWGFPLIWLHTITLEVSPSSTHLLSPCLPLLSVCVCGLLW